MAENRLALIWGVVFVWLTQILTPLRAGTGSFMCFLKCLAHAPSLMIDLDRCCFARTSGWRSGSLRGERGCGALLGPRESGRRWVLAMRGHQGPFL